jgi:hypothetical protein
VPSGERRKKNVMKMRTTTNEQNGKRNAIWGKCEVEDE